MLCVCVCCQLSVVCCLLTVEVCLRLFFHPRTTVLGVAHPQEAAPKHRGSWNGLVPNQPPRGGNHNNVKETRCEEWQDTVKLASHGSKVDGTIMYEPAGNRVGAVTTPATVFVYTPAQHEDKHTRCTYSQHRKWVAISASGQYLHWSSQTHWTWTADQGWHHRHTKTPTRCNAVPRAPSDSAK